ncbi:MAG: histidine kinase [Gammaproteobacteria bacterium]|nr:histidine kinase [Gammaproteobacteria bacterium]NNM00618.1 histidine kinase [Gammaproteobacteria bacterium]
MPPVRVRYQTLEFDGVDIHVRTLRDKQQFADDGRRAELLGICSASWPLFGVIWESGEVLARLMFAREVDGLRILEVGCGIGLASLVLGYRRANITATDHHPEAGEFLSGNVALNGLQDIPFLCTGWQQTNTILGRFDLIIGSDILYDHGTVDTLFAFIERHARASCEVVIVDPGRGLEGRFKRSMETHGYTTSESVPDVSVPALKGVRGRILTFTRRPEPLPCTSNASGHALPDCGLPS